MSQTKKEEKALLTVLDVQNIKKEPRYLFENITLFPYVVIKDGDYQVMIRTDEIIYVEVSDETPYVTISMKNGKSVEIGWGEE